jgi:hypothetical protein
MHNGPLDGRQGEQFVGCEVEFDARKIAAGRDRPAVINPALAGGLAALVLKDVEAKLFGGNLKPGLIVNPRRDVRENPEQNRSVEMSFIDDGEVEIFGEPIGFEIALLQTRAALEYPVIAKLGIGADAGEQPAEHVVFFDNGRGQTEIGRELQEFGAGNHDGRSFAARRAFAHVSGIHSRQARTRRGHSRPGSSFALPCVSRVRQAETRSFWWVWVSARKPIRLNTAPLPSFSAY